MTPDLFLDGLECIIERLEDVTGSLLAAKNVARLLSGDLDGMLASFFRDNNSYGFQSVEILAETFEARFGVVEEVLRHRAVLTANINPHIPYHLPPSNNTTSRPTFKYWVKQSLAAHPLLVQ